MTETEQTTEWAIPRVCCKHEGAILMGWLKRDVGCFLWWFAETFHISLPHPEIILGWAIGRQGKKVK
jgi:hypothetical protein